MKLEDIQDEWAKDSFVDKMKLGIESISIPKLHSKYYKILSHERNVLRKYEADYKVLRLEKFEFYTQGPSKETQEKGWQLPASGKILKSEVNNYIEADKDIILLSLKIGVQQEKIAFVESIIKTLFNRNYEIKNYIEFEKFMSGG